jgi:hypothetical protein
MLTLDERDRGLVERHLGDTAPRAICDICLAERVDLPVETVLALAEKCAGEGWCQRKVGRCSPCHSTRRVVTRPGRPLDTVSKRAEGHRDDAKK